MNAHVGQSLNRVLNQLSGAIVLEATDLEGDVELLVEAATAATGVQGALDVEAILETLAEVGQRHCDAGRR